MCCLLIGIIIRRKLLACFKKSKVENIEKERPKNPGFEYSAFEVLGYIASGGVGIFHIAKFIVILFIIFRILAEFPGCLFGDAFYNLMLNIAAWFLKLVYYPVRFLLKSLWYLLTHLGVAVLVILALLAVYALAVFIHWFVYSKMYNGLLRNYNSKYQRTLDDLNNQISKANTTWKTANHNFEAVCDKYNIPENYRNRYALREILSNMNTWNLSFYEACRKYDEDEYRDDIRRQNEAAAEWAKMQEETRQLAEDEYRKKVISGLNDIKQQEYENGQRLSQEMEYDRWRRNLE